MNSSPLLIKENELCSNALDLMNRKKISCLFIEKNRKPIGIVHIHDCLKIDKH
jgi:arabinose-5-phosphate isomerase